MDLAKHIKSEQSKKQKQISISADVEGDLDTMRKDSMESLNLFGLPDDLMGS